MPLSNTQKLVAQCTKRFRVVIAGRRWGKTTLAMREICKIARDPGKTVYYIAPTYRQAKTILWKRLKHKLMDLKWVKSVNETNLEIVLKNQSVICLKGADNPDSLRGISLSAAIFDEFSFLPQSTWDLVIRPALADQQGPALFITTPIGKSNWAYNLFCMQEKYPDNWQSFQFTTLQGGFVPLEEIEAARNEMSEQQFKQEFEASWITASSLVAWAFSREHNVKVLDKPDTRRIHVGMDFNVSPVTACIYVQKADDLYQIDEINMLNSNTNEMAEELKRRFPTSEIVCYPDPAGAARKTSAGGQTDHSILRNAGFTVKAPNRHNPVKDRINSYNARLCSSNGDRRLFIDPKCKHTIESLEKFSFKEGTMIPDKNGFDHMFDAASYAVDFMFPIKRNIDPESMIPQRWGHALA